MNILITSAGRRTYLVQYFKQALAGRGRILAADASPLAPALTAADGKYLLPRADDPAYAEELLRLCQTEDVSAVLSTNDLELSALSGIRDRLHEAGVVAIVSSSAVVDLCLDKLRTAEYVTSLGLRAPKTFTDAAAAVRAEQDGKVRFPLVVKPRWGSASFAIEHAFDATELELALGLVARKLTRVDQPHLPGPAVLIQEMIHGVEYGLDVVNDLDGRYVATIVKEKLRMRAGETDCARTVESRTLDELGRTLGQALGHVGNLDCDVFVDGGAPCVLELNPRFGGGYPFSHFAGANVPAAIVAWLSGEDATRDLFRVGNLVTSAKTDIVIGLQENAPQGSPSSSAG